MSAGQGSFLFFTEFYVQPISARVLPKSSADCKLVVVFFLYIAAALILGGGAFTVVRRRKLLDARLREEALSAEVAAIRATARAEAAALVSASSAEAKEKLLDARHAA